MKKTPQQAFPKWLFTSLAVCGLLASGIYLGVMSVAGLSGIRIAQAAGFGAFGLLMLWGALSRA